MTYNGDVAATVKNDPSSGYPCDGSKCLIKTGRYIVEGTISGGTLEYVFEFTATKPERPSPEIGSRMWLGAGEAAFTGQSSAAPPMPSTEPKTTQVKAINAISGKDTAQGKRGADGHDKRGYTLATEPRLTVLWGTAVVFEGTMA